MFHFKPFLVSDVTASLAHLNTHKSTGADGISAHLLRTVAGAIAPSITKLFNASLLQGQILSKWKRRTSLLSPRHLTQSHLPSFVHYQSYPFLPKSSNRLLTSRSTPVYHSTLSYTLASLGSDHPILRRTHS